MSKLVQLYVDEVKKGMSLEDVPSGLRAKVEAALAADKEENGVV
ncbi:CD1375 family protein [Oscillibacter sp.]|nr:CD1375 family protein [Oscillibacter sp.]MDD3347521.1 CD1375 family protein [Oscillibacter sp.]